MGTWFVFTTSFVQSLQRSHMNPLLHARPLFSGGEGASEMNNPAPALQGCMSRACLRCTGEGLEQLLFECRWREQERARGNGSLSYRFLPWHGTEPGMGKSSSSRGVAMGRCAVFREVQFLPPAVHRGDPCDTQLKSTSVCQVWGLRFILQVVGSSRGLFQRLVTVVRYVLWKALLAEQ